MKRNLLFGCITGLAVSGALAQTAPKPDNAAFYLVGSMNGWETPGTDSDNTRFRVMDEDGDGIYSASFEINAGECDFKVFSEPASEWNPDIFYGSWESSILLFKGEPYQTTLRGGYDSNNIRVANWETGILNVSISWVWDEFTEKWIPSITMSGRDQPQAPAAPEVYMIGDFNDWKLPTASNVNGAKKLTESYIPNSGYSLNDEIEFSPRDVSLAFCKFDRETEKYYFLSLNEYCPFTLYRYEDKDGYVIPANYIRFGAWKETTDSKEEALTILDWKGGKIKLTLSDSFNPDSSPYIYLTSDSTPLTEMPGQLYYIVDRNGEKELFQCNTPVSYFQGSVLNGSVSITLTSENNLMPDPANCWGIDGTLEDAGLSVTTLYKSLTLVKGGKPFAFDFEYGGQITVGFSLPNSTANVNLEFIGGPISADKVYICGDVSNKGIENGFLGPNAANQEKYDEYFRLEEVSKGVFEGIYYVPAKHDNYSGFPYNLPQFRFFTNLAGWTNEYSLGSNYEDFYCEPIDLENGPVETSIIPKGLGNWGPCLGESWTSAYLKVRVDLNRSILTMSRIDSGIEETGVSKSGIERWFNLQGLPVENPENGLFIHIVDGKSRVEMVK